ncbi:MAG TPA: DUF1990 domain-containing protein [Vicinamibacterales bacterium]|nr:DUF1990 domain-containing protein [Vicinamibacterales bacterium]
MFSIARPSTAAIAAFLARAQTMRLSYSPIGIARARAVPGFNVDETTAIVGHGDADYQRAVSALVAWKHTALDWLQLYPPQPSIETGTVVATLVRHWGLWSLNGCRVVYGVEETTGVYASFGFAYGTLIDHAERGEEIFQVKLDRQTRDVTYTVRAASQPRALAAKVAVKAVRSLQERFRRESCEALRRAIAAR